MHMLKVSANRYRFSSNHTVRNYALSYIELPEHIAQYCLFQSTDNIEVFCPTNYTTITERDVII